MGKVHGDLWNLNRDPSFWFRLAPKVAFHMGELHKIGFDTYRKTESKVKVVIDDGKEVVSIVLFFQNTF